MRLPIDEILTNYDLFEVRELKERRITFSDIEPLIKDLNNSFHVEIAGFSEKGTPVYAIKIGSGVRKVFGWTQMHGNESTGTKAIFDLFGLLASKIEGFEDLFRYWLDRCTMTFLVMLNPDGAEVYTRENLNGVDLNRDAVDRKAIESQLLRSYLIKYKPDFCFNLHDQRSIFNVSGSAQPATLSFLAPSEEEGRLVTPGRVKTMNVISAMNNVMQEVIPNRIGRYTDEFYPTATGDNFQKLGYPTILIEAGHTPGDYQRNITRKYTALALMAGIHHISGATEFIDPEDYFTIPENDTRYLDALYTQVLEHTPEGDKLIDVGVQYVFQWNGTSMERITKIERKGNLKGYYPENVINAEKKSISELKLSNS
jgi:hypothetical protein